MFDEGLIRARRRLHEIVSGHGSVAQSRAADRLFAGDYSTSVTVATEFAGSRLGLGVMHDLAGEVVSRHGVTWRIPDHGRPIRVGPNEGLAFAMAAHGGRRHELGLPSGTDFAGVAGAVDRYLADTDHDHAQVVCAVEIIGQFDEVMLRTVAPPEYQGEPLAEVIDHERRFSFPTWHGSMVGFKFPDEIDGTRIPGLHLHGISTDESSGGHVRSFIVSSVTAFVWVDEVQSPGESQYGAEP